MLERIVSAAPLYLLVAGRCFALIMSLPLFSSKSISRIAKVALAGYMAFFMYPQVSFDSGMFQQYAKYASADGSFTLVYVLALAGEVMIGLLSGLFVQIIFAAFSTAGQFFAFQMGLSASEVYDSLSQVENPLMGQFFNFLAMLVFLQSKWFNQFFFEALSAGFQCLNAFTLVESSFLPKFLIKSLSLLFFNALVMALPLMGSLFLINVTVGILSKAAPQMNLLSEGFPILMIVAYFLVAILIPQFVDFFLDTFKDGYSRLNSLFVGLSGGGK